MAFILIRHVICFLCTFENISCVQPEWERTSSECQNAIERPCTPTKHICKTRDCDWRIIGCKVVQMEPGDRPGNSSFANGALARSTPAPTPGFIKSTNERLRERHLRPRWEIYWSKSGSHTCGGATNPISANTSHVHSDFITLLF